MLEGPERDRWQKPAELVRKLKIRPGSTVADIGAGTGYLLPYLSPAVRPHGKVYAEEIQETFLANLERHRIRLRNVEVVRGTPLLLQLFVLYYGLSAVVRLPAFAAALLGLALNYAAYESEIYRGALLAVSRGQLEAARTLGLREGQVFRLVRAPQAFRLTLAPMTNDFVALLKDSSLVSVITVVELTKIDQPTREYESFGEVFESALRQEQQVTEQINDLYELAFKSKAFAEMTELQWFLTEQVEEEKTAREWVARFRLVGDDPGSLLDLDRELGARASGLSKR